jgi:hypothetical protein
LDNGCRFEESGAATATPLFRLGATSADRFDPAHDHRDKDQEQGDAEDIGQNGAIISQHLNRV